MFVKFFKVVRDNQEREEVLVVIIGKFKIKSFRILKIVFLEMEILVEWKLLFQDIG